ncbi:MAG TPA: hypothetical protein VGC76_19135 [Pyrinomonadaceae bacterium]|jgi:hypothetical protein
MKHNFLIFFLLVFSLMLFSLNAGAQMPDGKTSKPAANVEKINKPDVKLIKSIVDVIDFSGEGAYEILANNPNWMFVGPNREITVKESQKIVGYGSAVFGTSSGTSQIAVSLCYQKKGDSAVFSFAGDNHLIADADSLRRTFAVSVSTALPAGTYSVGYCVVNRGPQTLDNNNYVNGWIMVVN